MHALAGMGIAVMFIRKQNPKQAFLRWIGQVACAQAVFAHQFAALSVGERVHQQGAGLTRRHIGERIGVAQWNLQRVQRFRPNRQYAVELPPCFMVQGAVSAPATRLSAGRRILRSAQSLSAPQQDAKKGASVKAFEKGTGEGAGVSFFGAGAGASCAALCGAFGTVSRQRPTETQKTEHGKRWREERDGLGGNMASPFHVANEYY